MPATTIRQPTIWARLPAEAHAPMAALWAELLRRHLRRRRATILERQVHREQSVEGGASPPAPIRQSTPQQMINNQESTRRQYALLDRARQMGWAEANVHVID